MITVNGSYTHIAHLSLLRYTPEVGIPSRLVAHLPATTADVTERQWRFPGIVQGDLQRKRRLLW